MNHGRIKLKKLEIFITKIVRNFQNSDSKGMKSLLNDSSVISKIISTTNLVPFTIISRLDEEILFLFLSINDVNTPINDPSKSLSR